MGGVSATGASIVQATNVNSNNFAGVKYDGWLGVAWPGLSVEHLPTIFELLAQQNTFDSHSFSFYYTKEGAAGSSLVLGGVNPKYAASSFKYYDIKDNHLWMVDVAGITFDGKSVGTSTMTAIFDSAITGILGPTKIMDTIKAYFGTDGTVDCSKINDYPDLTFTIGEDDYTFKSSDYILKVVEQSTTVCVAALASFDLDPSLGDAFVFGNTFMKSFYTHFDAEDAKLGLAKAA